MVPFGTAEEAGAQLNVLSKVMHACMCTRSLSRVRVFATLQTVAHQASLSMGFSRQEYCSGLLCPPPGDFPDPGLEPKSLTSPQGHIANSKALTHPAPGFRPLILEK